ncbi:hypothetical protein EOL73_02335 [Candidatus Saccharibacteria bacterium]|nr:hypothetical protein [Candidatus Saccharibacteria bacterium]NCU40574.1 hypothetical protein [Candidatus Saccharibacteria bacterium]
MQPKQQSGQQAQTGQANQVVQSADQGVNQGMPTVKNPNSTQNTLLISEIRENMTIMNDGSFRAVIGCESINFDLMSNEEREAAEYSYQNFLNSLYFPVQILIRSTKVDIGPYLDKLNKLRRSQDNMLLGVLMDDYMSFISVIAEETNIMQKNFYVVVPYFPTGDLNNIKNASKGIFNNLFSSNKQQRVMINQETYIKGKEELTNRINSVMSGLMQMGIHTSQLNTKQLGELYYNSYNPDTAVRQPLLETRDMTASFIQKGQGQAPRPNAGGIGLI